MLSRRRFLEALASVGVVGGCRSSKIVTGDVADASVFSGPNLKLSRVIVEVGVTSPFDILHVTDTHLNFMSESDQVDSGAQKHFTRRWTRFPQSLNSLYSALSFAENHGIPILHTGDLIDYGSDANYELLRRNLSERMDFLYAIGNHEYHYRGLDDPSDREQARIRLQRVMPCDVAFSAKVIGGVNFVLIDNANGSVSEETARRTLDEFSRGLPVVLLCHVPPVVSGEMVLKKKRIVEQHGGLFMPEDAVGADDTPCESCGLAEDVLSKNRSSLTLDFVARLRKERQLKAVLCGHTHLRHHELFSETAMMYVGGGNYEGYGRVVRFT